MIEKSTRFLALYAKIIVLLLSQFCLVAQSAQIDEHKIDSLIKTMDQIIEEAIDSMAFPGCQIAIAYGDSIILNKSYGHHTYEALIEVKNNHIYDVASLTKVSTGLPLLMKLYANGIVDLDAPIERYLPQWAKSNKAGLTLREILAHQARLIPYIVFWQEALKEDGSFKRRTFRHRPNRRYNIQIADDLYLHRRYQKHMQSQIKNSHLLQREGYRYSGLLFLLLPELIEELTGGAFIDVLQRELYDPLDLGRIGYHPLSKISRNQIVPTEYDSTFRKQLVHGYVHDEAAAMLGTSCNAGIFSNAEDLCRLFLMYQNHGYHNELSIIDSTTIQEFTRYQYESDMNRRGLGFDKPLLDYDIDLSYVAESASPSSFGHSGFTGTMAWADPEHSIVFIFLSNRVYPSRNQRNIYNLNVRPRLHQAVYDHLIHHVNN